MANSIGLAATIGFFDGVHCGHRFLFDYLLSYAQCHHLTPGVITFPVHPRKVLHKEYLPELLTDYTDKCQLIRQHGIQTIFSPNFTPELAAMTAEEFLLYIYKEYDVKALIMGYDHSFGSDRLRQFEEYERIGKRVGVAILRAGALEAGWQKISSSYIRRMLKTGALQEANRGLGRAYAIKGRIVHGLGLGHQLGFPTANIEPTDTDQLIPMQGVYAIQMKIDRNVYNGMANIGVRPTILSNGGLSIEANLFDVDRDLYGKEAEIRFISYLRQEEKFPSLEALKKRLAADKINAQAALSSPLSREQ